MEPMMKTKREQETDQIWEREEGKHRTWGHRSDTHVVSNLNLKVDILMNLHGTLFLSITINED